MKDNEKLIEEAGKAIAEAQGWLDAHPHFHSARKSDVKALVLSLSAVLAVFEKAHTPSDAQVEHMRRALNAADIDYSAREQRADAGGGDMEPGDWFTLLARAALRAAGGVR